MNAGFPAAMDNIGCFDEVPEYHEPVETDYSPSALGAGYVLDGRFKIEETLSRSGMATIYKAADLQNGHAAVVVKIPHLRFEADPAYFDRFRREEEIGLRLRHPALLRFVAVEGKKSRPYIVTEYLKGCTLAHLMNAQRPLPEADALKIAGRLCGAVDQVHALGVVHRDLKPGNVMICTDKTMRLMDFGLATLEGGRRITMTGLSGSMGTPDYMSPEQVRNAACDARTDIYSLGVILYEMLTGRVPFVNDNAWVAMNDRVTGDPVAPRTLRPELSVQAEEIVLRALRRNPAERYQTAAAMKADLDAPAKVRVTGLAHRLVAPTWRLSLQGTPVVSGILIALAFFALQAVLFFLLRRHLGR